MLIIEIALGIILGFLVLKFPSSSIFIAVSATVIGLLVLLFGVAAVLIWSYVDHDLLLLLSFILFVVVLSYWGKQKIDMRIRKFPDPNIAVSKYKNKKFKHLNSFEILAGAIPSLIWLLVEVYVVASYKSFNENFFMFAIVSILGVCWGIFIYRANRKLLSEWKKMNGVLDGYKTED